MTNAYVPRKIVSASWLAAVVAALTLAGCIQSGGYGSSSGYASPDPYHYRCARNCQAQAGG